MTVAIHAWNLTSSGLLMWYHHLAAFHFKLWHKLLAYIRIHCIAIYGLTTYPNSILILQTKNLRLSSIITSMAIQMLVHDLSSHFWTLTGYMYKGLAFNQLCNTSTHLASWFTIWLWSSSRCMNPLGQTMCGTLMAITNWSNGTLSFMVWLMGFVEWYALF